MLRIKTIIYNKTDKLRDVSNIKDYQYTRVPVKKEVMKIKGLASDVRQFFNGQEALINRKNINYINKVYNKMNLDRIMKNETATTSVRRSYSHNKQRFLEGGTNFVKMLDSFEVNDLQKFSDILNDFANVKTMAKRDEAVKLINDLLFEGESVIRNGASKNDIKGFINHLNDLVDYNLAKKKYNYNNIKL